MPSLNPRTPSPIPRINSGILRPPNRTKMTTRIISQCIGNSITASCHSYNHRKALQYAQSKLKYNTLIAHPARHPFAVEVLEQGYGELTGDAGKVFERGYRDT